MKILAITESAHTVDQDCHIIDTGEVTVCDITIQDGIEVSYCLLPKQSGDHVRYISIASNSTFRGSGIFLDNTASQVTTEIVGDSAFSRMDLLAIATDNTDLSIEGIAKVNKPYRTANIRVDQTNVLIGKNTKVRGVPLIEVATEDIEGGHSCRIHRLGGDALFYLQSRGFEEQHAEALLLNSEILRHLDTIVPNQKGLYCEEIHKRLAKK